jgi:hypothetical protein
MLLAFAAIATARFIPDGFIETMRDGHPVCCGEVIDRGWLRTFVVVTGTGFGTLFVLVGLLRHRPSKRQDAAGAQTIA